LNVFGVRVEWKTIIESDGSWPTGCSLKKMKKSKLIVQKDRLREWKILIIWNDIYYESHAVRE
jgi:hypothetical protein